MKNYKARGVVLHTVKYGDSSLVVYLLTDVFGRQNYLVQGVRANKGNKTALFQPLFLVEFEGYEAPKSQMHRMREVRCARPLYSIPFDARKSTVSLFMAEAVYRLIREVEPNSALFDFVWCAAAHLDAMQDGIANFHLWFLVRLSAYLGFYPGNEYTPNAWFDIKEGVFVHWMPRHGMALSQDNSRILSDMMLCEGDGLSEIALGRAQRVGFLDGMLTYFGYHLDAIHHVQSLHILREVF